MITEQLETIYDHNRPKRKHIMAGAEVPPLPDKQRPLENVLRDHAINTWGELRDVAVLDSSKATEILAAAMGRLLKAVRDDTDVFKKKIEERERAGSFVLGKLKQATSRPPRGEQEQDNRRRCNVCNQPFSSHTIDCLVRKAIEKGKEVGFTVGVEGD